MPRRVQVHRGLTPGSRIPFTGRDQPAIDGDAPLTAFSIRITDRHSRITNQDSRMDNHVFAIGVAFLITISAQAPRVPIAVFTDEPPTWFEDLAKVADVSPDGRWAVYGVPGARRLIDLQTGREAG